MWEVSVKSIARYGLLALSLAAGTAPGDLSFTDGSGRAARLLGNARVLVSSYTAPCIREDRRAMPRAGLEPARSELRGILSPLRLPFRHPGLLRM